jgi:hypothetical protein
VQRPAVELAGERLVDEPRCPPVCSPPVLYNEWAAYWPEHADEPFGDVMNSIKKYVVCNSRQAAECQNSEIIRGDVAQELTDIKAQDGGGIARPAAPRPSAGCCARAP